MFLSGWLILKSVVVKTAKIIEESKTNQLTAIHAKLGHPKSHKSMSLNHEISLLMIFCLTIVEILMGDRIQFGATLIHHIDLKNVCLN